MRTLSPWPSDIVSLPRFCKLIYKSIANIVQYNTYLIDHSPHKDFSGTMKHKETTEGKNNWPEANQLAIYKCSCEVQPGTTRIKFNEWSERVLNTGSLDLKASALTTGPHCLLLSPWLQTLFLSQGSTNLPTKHMRTLSPWLSYITSLSMIYQLNYESHLA